ncbi:50S ribosomal protein L21 [Candidatus Liberibacter brunswickensis]|uniref:50S ribosomal protein L21 n=1 Tax=Candidatus Liberibacter brunswickensis TaxID=1968796 RepID=UPI002FE0B0DD
MLAVIEHGGKQSIVSSNETITVEKIIAKDGERVRFDNVLAIGEKEDFSMGTTRLEGAYVEAEVIKQFRTKKVIVFKKRRRQNYRRTHGHRQEMTVVKITGIFNGNTLF